MFGEVGAMPRYPDIHVSMRTPNPLVLISAVRHALRRAGIERHEIARFSDEALTVPDPERRRQICRDWVDTTRTESDPLPH